MEDYRKLQDLAERDFFRCQENVMHHSVELHEIYPKMRKCYDILDKYFSKREQIVLLQKSTNIAIGERNTLGYGYNCALKELAKCNNS